MYGKPIQNLSFALAKLGFSAEADRGPMTQSLAGGFAALCAAINVDPSSSDKNHPSLKRKPEQHISNPRKKAIFVSEPLNLPQKQGFSTKSLFSTKQPPQLTPSSQQKKNEKIILDRARREDAWAVVGESEENLAWFAGELGSLFNPLLKKACLMLDVARTGNTDQFTVSENEYTQFPGPLRTFVESLVENTEKAAEKDTPRLLMVLSCLARARFLSSNETFDLGETTQSFSTPTRGEEVGVFSSKPSRPRGVSLELLHHNQTNPLVVPPATNKSSPLPNNNELNSLIESKGVVVRVDNNQKVTTTNSSSRSNRGESPQEPRHTFGVTNTPFILPTALQFQSNFTPLQWNTGPTTVEKFFPNETPISSLDSFLEKLVAPAFEEVNDPNNLLTVVADEKMQPQQQQRRRSMFMSGVDENGNFSNIGKVPLGIGSGGGESLPSSESDRLGICGDSSEIAHLSIAPSIAPFIAPSIVPSIAPSIASSIAPSVAPSIASSIAPPRAPLILNFRPEKPPSPKE